MTGSEPEEPKASLRRLLRTRRREFVDAIGTRARLFAIVVARCALEAAGDARRIASYLGNGRELDGLPALELAWAAGRETALPHLSSPAGPMRFLAWQPGDMLVKGPLGLLQPLSSAREIEPNAIFAPLVGFDRTGNRIGQGGGFYDRAFEAHPNARRIGLAWSIQELKAIPVDIWDKPLHAVITEREWIDCP